MSGTISEIPLIANPQTLAITLAGVVYNLRVTWCPQAAAWTLDILDVNSNPLVQGIPLVTSADLLEQYDYLGIGGQLFVVSDGNPTAVPTFYNLGSQGHLYFSVPSS